MVTKYSVARATEEEDGEVVSIWEVLGRRWSLLILKNLCTKEVIRFNEFKKLLSGISSTVLADRLLELEREGLVSKKIYPQIPPKVEYSLTIRAKELGVILRELGKWASRLAGGKYPELQRTQKQQVLVDQLVRDGTVF